MNLPRFDEKLIHFGFSLGVVSTGYLNDFDIRTSDTIGKVEVAPQGGFALGIIADLHLGPYFDLRFIPSLSFGQRNIEYTVFRPDRPSEIFSKSIESTLIDFPLNFKYRSARYNNFAAYIIGGGCYSIDLVSQERLVQTAKDLPGIVVRTTPNIIAAQIGFGFDFFLEYFKFSPELKMSYGINDIMVRDGSIFADPISRLNSKILIISFTFEG